MDYTHLRVFASLTALPIPKSSSELERVKGQSRKNMSRRVLQSDDSELSSVSSEELDIMGDNHCDPGGRGGSSAGGKKKVLTATVNESFLACHDEQFPSDGEEGEDVGRRRGGSLGRKGMNVKDLIAEAGVKRGRARGGKWAVPSWVHVDGNRDVQGTRDAQSSYYPRFGRHMMYTVPSSRGDSPPVTIGGFKSATVTRVNPGVAQVIDSVQGGKDEPKKRRPRLDASLKICKDFVTDVLSKKNKVWVWPLCKQDRGRDAVFSDPIYLLDIKTKLANREYKTAEDFASDMRKLIGNYCRYYPANHQYYNSAKVLKEWFEKEFKGVEEGEDGRGGDGRKESLGGSLDCSGPGSSGAVGEGGKRGIMLAANKLKAASLNRWIGVGSGVGGVAGDGKDEVGSSGETVKSSDLEGAFGSQSLSDPVHISLDCVKVEMADEEEDRGENSSATTDGGKRGHGDDVGDEEEGKRRKVEEQGSLVDDVCGGDINGVNEVIGRKAFVCKWLVDGFGGSQEQQVLLRTIRAAVGVDNLEMEVGVLGGLGDRELEIVGDVIFRGVMGIENRVNNESVQECQQSRVLRNANEAISDTQSDWSKMQEDLSLIRTNVYDTLIKINKMQEVSFETLNKLHERKNNLGND